MILITGANGSLGFMIAKHLIARGARVRGMKRPGENALSLPSIEWVEATLEDTSSLTRACEGADMIIHCAAVTHTNDEKIYHN